MKIVLVDANCDTTYPDVPLGIGCVAAMLKQEGIPYVLHDQSLERPSLARTIAAVLAEEPDVLGLSCYTWTIRPSVRIARAVKARFPRCTVVMGGPYVSGDPELVFARCPEVDIIVRGDGEETFRDLVTRPSSRPLSAIDGISFREEDAVYHTVERLVVRDLDRLPSPILEEVFDLSRYPRASIGFSRGCPQNCIFCAWGTQTGGGAFRKESLERFLAELEVIKAARVPTIIPHDGTFNFSDSFLHELCAELRRRELLFSWMDVDMRADWVTREQLEDLKSIGTFQVGFGYETVSPVTQRLIRKNLDPEALVRAVGWAREMGFKTHCGFIVGLPGETREDILRSAEFARVINPDEVGVFPLVALPGTELYKNHVRYGLRLLFDWGGDPFAIECETTLMSVREKLALSEQLANEFTEFNKVCWEGIARDERARVLRLF